jgi:hypothetical protein
VKKRIPGHVLPEGNILQELHQIYFSSNHRCLYLICQRS